MTPPKMMHTLPPAAETLFPADAHRLILGAESRQDLILLAANLGIGVAVVAGRYAKLTHNWKIASPLRGQSYRRRHHQARENRGRR